MKTPKVMLKHNFLQAKHIVVDFLFADNCLTCGHVIMIVRRVCLFTHVFTPTEVETFFFRINKLVNHRAALFMSVRRLSFITRAYKFCYMLRNVSQT